MHKYLLLFLLSCTTLTALAQKQQLTGIVKDASGQPLPGAGVYIANSKMAASTDANGRFSFTLEPGNYDVLFQMIGFLPANKNVVIKTAPVQLTMTLKESETKIGEVVIRPDKDREYYISVFKEYFIGKTPNSTKTKLLNPNALRVDFDSKTRKLTVTADQFLQLENAALGYKIKYLLRYFEYDFKANIVYYEGFPTFEEMAGGTTKQNRWNRMRLTAYNGSIQHFFKTLAERTTVKEGFLLHKVTPMKMSEQSNLARPGINIITAKSPPSMLRRENILIDTLVHNGENGSFFLNFKDELYVIYQNEREEGNYQTTGFWQSRPLDIPNYQISKITPLRLPLRFYKSGAPADPAETLYSGYFAYEKVGDQLPIEYEAPKARQ